MMRVPVPSGEKLTQEESGYISAVRRDHWAPPGQGIRCGTCIYFGSANTVFGYVTTNVGGTCRLVAGNLDSQGCCNVWNIFTRENPGGRWLSGPASIEKARRILGR